ncbi:MAG: divalent-cation tolerance protein CutA [Betaproteobacteria bacterium]|nr:divalent-cation tolerance protein CutA [Betaproteobacteria bacterium]
MSESHMTEHQRSQNQVTENQIPEHPKAGLIALHTSVGSEADALALAKMALEAKRAACVQIDTIQSLYPWDGSIQHETEWRILFKTSPKSDRCLMPTCNGSRQRRSADESFKLTSDGNHSRHRWQ